MGVTFSTRPMRRLAFVAEPRGMGDIWEQRLVCTMVEVDLFPRHTFQRGLIESEAA